MTGANAAKRTAAQQAAVLRGRLDTLLGLPCDEAALDALRATADGSLGPDHSESLRSETLRQQRLSYRRTVGESVTAWAGLRRRAEECLPPQDSTRLLIRSHYIRALRLRSLPEDLDQAVTLREQEVAEKAERLPQGDDLPAIARSDLALALIDRARTMGRVARARSAGVTTDPAADLVRAEELIDREIRYRKQAYPQEGSLLYASRLILAELNVGLAEYGEPADRRDHAGTGAMIARNLVGYYGRQSGGRSLRGLKSRLLLAESLALAGQPADGARTARLALAVAGFVTENIDQGWPFFTLARIMRLLDEQEARKAAEHALEERQKIFPEQSYRVIEVREFLQASG